jgi:hypothetical protein
MLKQIKTLRKNLSRKMRLKIRSIICPNQVHDYFHANYPFRLKELSNLKFKSFGDKNPNKFFYVIWRDNIGSGFFANLNSFLSHLEFAKKMNFIPLIDCENFPTIYNTTNPINNSKNSWEYYFHQPSPYSLEEVYQSKNVFFSSGFEMNIEASIENRSDKKLRSNRQIFLEDVKLQDNVKQELAKYDQYFSDDIKILGVHIRGKDMNTTQLHPFGPTMEQIFRYTDEMLTKYKIDKIFLACEDLNCFEMFLEKYRDKTFFIDVFRLKKYNSFNINPRENHRYLLGLEVLVEAILLSKCSHFLRGSSNIANFVVSTGNHEVIYSISNGTNFKKRYLARFGYDIKKHLPKNFFGLKDELTIIEK